MAVTHLCSSASLFGMSCFPKDAASSSPIHFSQQRVFSFNPVLCYVRPRDTIEHSGNVFGSLPEKHYSHRESGTSSSTATKKAPPPRPRRIILVRHGQSEGNVDESVYTRVSDPKIRLIEKGKKHAACCCEGQEDYKDGVVYRHFSGLGQDHRWN